MILAVLQVRTSSTRLPGKALLNVLGCPLLEYEIERVRRSKKIDELVVATTDRPEDDAIARLCVELKVKCFRGSLNDVLDRFYQAAKPYNAAHIVRLTGDCPLIDPEVIDQTIDHHLKGHFDYTSNWLIPTFPDGLDNEVIRFRCLQEAWQKAELQSQREHVTPYLYQHPNRYRIGIYKSASDLSALRWTVDEPADFELVKRILEALYPAKPEFKTADILKLLKQKPELSRLNQHIQRNAGYQKSLANDRHV